jgi:hypothetical protein
MKICLQCGLGNMDSSPSCGRCHHREFAPATPEFLTIEENGSLTELKCRTPQEALLIAEQCEAADILAVVPDGQEMLVEFNAKGYVSVNVSTRSYQAAKELQAVVERRYVQARSSEKLPMIMVLVAVFLGVLWCPGMFFFFMIKDIYRNKGYEQKAKSFVRWFWFGFALFFIVGPIIADLIARNCRTGM